MRSASDRLPRLLALVPYLLAHPGARLADVAEVFDISERQLRSDLDLVFVCGLPGQGPGDLIEVSYEGDRVTVSNADAIARPLRLATEEALALIVALRTLAGLPGLGEAGAVDRALVKLEAAAGSAADAADRVSVVVETADHTLEIARDALERGRRLHLVYHVPGKDETTERDVDPMRLLLVEGRSYLEAWCRRAEAVRLFRLDRVLDLAVLDLPAEIPAQATPRDLREGVFRPSADHLLVTLELDPPARWVADYYPCETVEELPGGGLRASLRTPDTAWVRRLALRLGAAGRVVAPAEVVAQVHADATAALSAYDEVADTRVEAPEG